jgi:small subunit ribosomal protein S16
MVRLRFTRVGRKNLPAYRIVAIYNREKRESHALELLGTYSPLTKKTELNTERINYWLSVGAQPSDTVKRLLIKNNVIKADKKEKKAEFKKAPKKKAQERKAKKDAKAEAPVAA